MALNDRYRLWVRWEQNGVAMESVFGYKALQGGLTAAVLVANFNATLSAYIKSIQSDSVVWKEFEAINLDNPLHDFNTATTSGTGDIVGDYNPTFLSWGYEYVGTTKETRSGGKRIPGVAESWVINGSVNPAFQTDLDDVGLELAKNLQHLAVDSWSPMILRVTGTQATGYTIVENLVSAVIFKRITTQNSRKE